MTRLPNPGGDDDTWGDILNDYLEVAHNANGTLKSSAVSASGAEQAANKNVANGYAGLDGSAKVPLANLPSTTVPDADATTKGALKLTGDLGGTANSPTVPGLASKATQAGLDAVSALLPVFNVKAAAYGATGDGTTDDTTAINAAYAAAVSAGGGTIYFPAGTYRTSGSGLSINSNTRVEIRGYGATLKPDASSTALTVDPGTSGGGALGGTFRGFRIQSTGTQTQTAIKLRNCLRWRFSDLRIDSGSIGILISNDGSSSYNEDNHFDNIYIASSNTGLKLEVINGGGPSFEENTFVHVSISGCSTGINIGTGVDMCNTSFYATKLWATNPGSQVCLYCDGKMADMTGFFHFESLSGSGNTAISLGPNTTFQNQANINCGFLGTWGTKIVKDAAVVLPLHYQDGPFHYQGGATGGNTISLRRDTDTADRVSMTLSSILWGPGGSTTPTQGIFTGSGTPEGSKTASVGSIYLRSDGGANTSFYVKESGSGNTGWVAK